MSDSQRPAIGRPRRELADEVFAETLRLVNDVGYAKATCERVASGMGVAKTTIYRRWPTKGELIVDVLLDAFGPVPVVSGDRHLIVESSIRWIASKIEQPGVGAAFAGVFSDAIRDPALRATLATKLQDPYRLALQDALGESEQRVLFLIDVVTGTLLHRLGMTGAPMDDSDLNALIELVRAAMT